MDRKYWPLLNTVNLMILLFGNMDKVYCDHILAMRGNAVLGETFQLVCSSCPEDGVYVYAFYRASTSGEVGELIGKFKFLPSESGKCENISISYPFGCEDNGSKGYINITVPTDNVYTLTEHNKYWRCQTLSYPRPANNNEVHVSIIVPIAGISLISTPVSQDNAVTVVSDVPTRFQCQTTQGRPAANITWYLDNAPLSGGTTTTTPVSGDIVNTTGYLTLTVNRTAGNKVISCRATNYVNMEPVESKVTPVIRVKYPPSSPTYTLDVSGVSTDVSGSIDVIQGDSVRLTCNTVCNPPPATDQYSWTRSTGGSLTHRQQELTMTHINLSDEAVYRCKVTNTMTPTVGETRTGTNQSVIAVNVLYPPSTPNITYRCTTNPVSILVTNNTSYPVTCQSDGYKPVPSVQWTGREQTTDIGTLSVYNIQNSGNYTCTVNTTMIRRPGYPSTVSMTSTIEIQLLYGPEVTRLQSQYIVEGSPLNLTCTANSNPPVTSYYWSRPGSTDRDIEGSVLHTLSVLRSDAGMYTCHVGNVMLPTCEQHSSTGTGSGGTMLEVQYIPDIKGHTDRDVVEHQTSTIRCTAGGIPATYTFYNWTHVAPDNVTVLRSLPGIYNSTTTTLTLSDVNYQDTGYYRCSVSNGIQHYITGETTETTDVMFTVKSSPVTEPHEAVTGRKNGSAMLTVKFYSDDGTVPTVTWRKSYKQTVSNITDIKFDSSVNVSNVTLTMYGHSITDQPGFSGRLTVHTITQEDFTNYSCQISNTIGSTTVFLALKPEGPPDPPRQLRATQTYSSITLFWLSGFHGGADQTFTVEYRTTTETVFKVAAAISGGQKEGVQFKTTIQELSPDTQYVIQITCSNRFGQQKEIIFIETQTAPGIKTDIAPVSTSSIGPAVGGTIGGLLGVLLVGLIVYLLKRRVSDTSSNTDMRNTTVDGNRVYDTLQITSPDTSPYQTLELNDSSSSGVYVNLEL